jgi:hypothetical protein
MPIYKGREVEKKNALKVTTQRHTGASAVALCFSAAIMSNARTRAAVMNISMNTPCATLMPCAKLVLNQKLINIPQKGKKNVGQT